MAHGKSDLIDALLLTGEAEGEDSESLRDDGKPA